MLLKSRLFLLLSVFGLSSYLFAQEVGPAMNSQVQKVAACAYSKDSTDRASNFEINAARHLGSLGFFMEKEEKTGKRKSIHKGRGKGSIR